MKPWTAAEDAILTELYRQLSAGEIAARMDRSRASIKGRINVLRLKKPEGQTNSGRFVAGQPSWNKGMKGLQIDGGATRFKPGHLGGRAALLKQPIGAERLSKEGYLQRKVNDDTVFHKRWRFVHVMLWEEANGPVPAGLAIAFRNGDKTDIRLDNLECISRRELMARNTVHNYPPELVQVMRLKGAITKRLATREKKEQSA